LVSRGGEKLYGVLEKLLLLYSVLRLFCSSLTSVPLEWNSTVAGQADTGVAVGVGIGVGVGVAATATAVGLDDAEVAAGVTATLVATVFDATLVATGVDATTLVAIDVGAARPATEVDDAEVAAFVIAAAEANGGIWPDDLTPTTCPAAVGTALVTVARVVLVGTALPTSSLASLLKA
jgi:hypothetical protein